MLVYILGFLISLLLLYYAEKNQFTGRVAKTCSFIAILIPCLIAGLRSENVGTDVITYAKPLFHAASVSDSFLDFLALEYTHFGWDFNPVADFEIGFTLMTYLIQKIFGNFQVLLFAIQALTVIPIYKGLRAFSKTQPVWLGMAVYYLMSFNYSMNMMRQWIAMAFLFYAFQFLVQGNYRKYFLIWAASLLFHTTAFLGLAVFAIYQLVARKNSYGKTVKMLLIGLIGIVSVFGLEIITKLMSFLGFNYGSYITGTLHFMPNQLLYRLPIMLLFAVRWRYLKQKDVHARFYLLMVILDVLASQLTSIYAHAGRVGVYFSEYYMLAYPALYMSSDIKDNKKVIKWFILGYLCVYWWYTYAYTGSSETVPYEFFFVT